MFCSKRAWRHRGNEGRVPGSGRFRPRLRETELHFLKWYEDKHIRIDDRARYLLPASAVSASTTRSTRWLLSRESGQRAWLQRDQLGLTPECKLLRSGWPQCSGYLAQEPGMPSRYLYHPHRGAGYAGRSDDEPYGCGAYPRLRCELGPASMLLRARVRHRIQLGCERHLQLRSRQPTMRGRGHRARAQCDGSMLRHCTGAVRDDCHEFFANRKAGLRFVDGAEQCGHPSTAVYDRFLIRLH
mmetsp:Transcript_72532/g.170028  ORF Transcript_72532/g.170028 Transcript_72532/m.170028 type:complete len:242 (+) Transcript_72532:625-1350(+)